MGLPVVAVGLALAAARLAGAGVGGHLVPGHRAALATALFDAIGDRRPHYGRCDRHAG